MRAASLITTQPFLWNNLSDASGKNWVRLGEWFFAELTKEFEQQVMQGRSVRENEKSSYDQRPCNCFSASVYESTAAQADAAAPEFCLQRSTPAVMNQIACPSIIRPKPCTLSRICPERTPTMVRGH